MNLVQYVTKGFSTLEYRFEKKGLNVIGMMADLNQKDWADEELFGLLKDVQESFEILKTPCEVLLASIWIRIQSQCNRNRRGFLMRHTFGELKGKQMMQRLSTLARTLKYWTVIEQPIEFGVPFWLYEEIAKQKLPPNRATERIAEYRTHTKFDAPISRAVIAEEGEKLKSSHSTRGLVATMEDDKSSNCDNVSPLILKDSKDSSGDIVAESTIAIQSTKEEKTLIPVTETVSDPGLKLRTLTIDLPQWVLEGLDGIARKNKLSVAKMIEKLVKDELDGVAMTALPPTEKKDAPTIRTDN